MNQVRIGSLGCGNFGESHLQAFRAVAGAEIAAVFDTDRNRALRSLLPLYGRTHPALENCIHDVDLMLWYVNAPVRQVRGYARHAIGRKHPETFWGVLEFEGGAIGVIETIWMLPDAGLMLDDAFQFVGTEGVANIQLHPSTFAVLRKDAYCLPDVSYDPRAGGAARGALCEELAYFCECVAADRAPEVVTAIDAKRAVRVVLALIESAENGRDISLTEWD